MTRPTSEGIPLTTAQVAAIRAGGRRAAEAIAFREPLTVADIEAGYDLAWDGYGYLGERKYRWADVAAADAALLEAANALGWDRDQLFAFTNSRDGRWFADEAMHGGSPARAAGRYVTTDAPKLRPVSGWDPRADR